jgi:hypothetical protein
VEERMDSIEVQRSEEIATLTLRRGIDQEMRSREKEAIKEFVDIWYSEATWANLRDIKIY